MSFQWKVQRGVILKLSNTLLCFCHQPTTPLGGQALSFIILYYEMLVFFQAFDKMFHNNIIHSHFIYYHQFRSSFQIFISDPVVFKNISSYFYLQNNFHLSDKHVILKMYKLEEATFISNVLLYLSEKVLVFTVICDISIILHSHPIHSILAKPLIPSAWLLHRPLLVHNSTLEII